MSVDFQKLLNELGLTPTETRVYMASLKLGPTSVQEIAKVARLSRTASYDVIATLQDRGLMSSFERGKKNFFSAEDPERALAYFRGRIVDLQDKIELFGRSLGEIKLLSGGERPLVRLFEGQEALYSLYNDFALCSPKEVYELSNVDAVYTTLDPKLLLSLRKSLDETRVKIRMLHIGDLRNPRPGAEYCRLLPEFGTFNGDIWIYADRVVFVQFVGKVSIIIIESQSFADMTRVLFKAAWHICSAQGYRKTSS